MKGVTKQFNKNDKTASYTFANGRWTRRDETRHDGGVLPSTDAGGEVGRESKIVRKGIKLSSPDLDWIDV